MPALRYFSLLSAMSRYQLNKAFVPENWIFNRGMYKKDSRQVAEANLSTIRSKSPFVHKNIVLSPEERRQQ
ncbi:hypothetical protein BTUL_0084g00480 [Botrytis tulipae]|uniref:Uncharacterized protein n=1 Tax=Botrytis tulipae TaxID=87230 RepID=A0A4Z1ENB6_9HELO|nr:hypothetical protein BTUL_0084g00480 [Botrytis tulipae]